MHLEARSRPGASTACRAPYLPIPVCVAVSKAAGARVVVMLLRSDFQGPGDVTEHWGFAGVSRKMSKKTLARRGSEAFGLGPLDSPSNMSFRSTDSHESQVCTETDARLLLVLILAHRMMRPEFGCFCWTS
jgi:hypothetical protein